MSRSRSSTVKYIIYVVCCLVSVYGLFTYHEIHTHLKTAEEKLARVSQQHDSVSAQLQVVYEHKSRLEKSLEQEKSDHKNSREALKQQMTRMDTENEGEKSELMGRIDSINQQNKMLQNQVEDQQLEYRKLEEEVNMVRNANERSKNEQNDEYLLYKQEKDLEIGLLKDEIANWKRNYGNLESQLEKYKSQILLQQNPQHAQPPQQLQQQQRLQEPQQQFQQQQRLQEPQQQQFQQQQRLQEPQQQQQFQQQQRLQEPQQQFQNAQQNQVQAGQQNQQFQNHEQFDQRRDEHAQNADANNQVQHDDVLRFQAANNNEQDQHHMQINKPGDKPAYFEPKLPDNADRAVRHLEESENDDVRAGQVVNEQVVQPPKGDQRDAGDVKADQEPAENFDFALKHRRDNMVYEEEEEEEEEDENYDDNLGDDENLDDDEADDDDVDDEGPEEQGIAPNENIANGYIANQNIESKYLKEKAGLQAAGDADRRDEKPILAPDADDIGAPAEDNIRPPAGGEIGEDTFNIAENPVEDADAKNSRLKLMSRLKGYINNQGVFKQREDDDDFGVKMLENADENLNNDHEQDRLDYKHREDQVEQEQAEGHGRPLLANGLRGRKGQGQDDVVDKVDEQDLLDKDDGGMGDGNVDEKEDYNGDVVDDRHKELYDEADDNEDEKDPDANHFDNFEMR